MAKIQIPERQQCQATTKEGFQCNRAAKVSRFNVEDVPFLWLFERRVKSFKFYCRQHGKYSD